MRTQTSYLLIGTFVISGLAMLTAALVALGAGAGDRDVIRAETLFDETVAGLEVGAPVRFRGVTVGRVTQITVAGALYLETKTTYVVVRFELWGPEGLPLERLRETLPKRIEEGLRVRQASSGLTGISFLEADILADAEKYPPKPRDWMPDAQRDKFLYIPSAASQLGEVFNSLEGALTAVVRADLPGLVTDLRAAVVGMREDVRGMQLASLGGSVEQTLQRLRDLATTANAAIDKISGVTERMGGTVERAGEALQRSSGQFDAMAAAATATLRQVETATAKAETLLGDPHLRETLAHLETAGQKLTQVLDQTQSAMRDAQGLFAGRGREVGAILDNLERVTAQLRALTATAEQYPSWLLFGSPPPRSPGR